MKLNITTEDFRLLLSLVSARKNKLKRGLDKFSSNFDKELGENLTRGYATYSRLETVLKEAQSENDHSRSAGRDPREYEGRRNPPGNHRPAG